MPEHTQLSAPLHSFAAESVRRYLALYLQEAREIRALAAQITAAGA